MNSKLYEIKNTKQIPGEPKRRWFSSLDLDLIVWLNDDESIIGFQLSYDKLFDQRALTVYAASYFHAKVDDGNSSAHKMKSSPQLKEEDMVNGSRLAQLFLNEADTIDRIIAEHVYENILRISAPMQGNRLVS